LVKTLELMGLESEAASYGVLPLGMVRFPEGKMSSRTGKNILYSDFSEEVKEIAKKGLIKRGVGSIGVRELEDRAMKIAIASIKYSMLKQDARKTMIFDPKSDVSFEGDTGAYLLYSYARAASILRKVGSRKSEVGSRKNFEGVEVRLLKKIDSFGEVVVKAYENLAPNLVANYCFDLATLFNGFYHACPVLGSDEEGFRLALVRKFKESLGEGLDLLGIETLEEM
ncbi:MAG: hypothetical protein KJ592_05095, partial [Nanoarchaeota archaeon]|nr:hypothetical protein [Nanoarchaeota archaeon]